MRPRIAMAIVSSNGDTVVRRETHESCEKNKRRAEFEKNYARNKAIFSCIKTKTPNLVEFSNNVANAIAEFKKSKQ